MAERPTKEDLDLAERLLSSARSGGDEFEEVFITARLDRDPTTLVRVHALLVLVTETVFRLRFPATRRKFRSSVNIQELVRQVTAQADPALLDADRCLATLAPPPATGGGRGLGLGGLPLTRNELYTVAVCCNVVIDDSLRDIWVLSDWRKRFKIASRAARRRFTFLD